MMPNISGLDLIAVLKNDPNTQDIPIIILSILENQDAIGALGIEDYFTKPIDFNKLLDRVKNLLEKRREQE